MGPAIGVEQHGQRAIAPSSRTRGHDQGRDQPAGSELDDLDVQLQARLGRVGLDEKVRTLPPPRPHRAPAPGPVHRAAGDHSRVAAYGDAVHSGRASQPSDCTVPADPGDVNLGRVDRGSHEGTGLVGVVNGPHLHIVGREGLTVQAQPPGSHVILRPRRTPVGFPPLRWICDRRSTRFPVLDRDQPGPCQSRDAGHELHPCLVGDPAQESARARAGVGLQHAEGALVAALNDEQQPVVAPAHSGQVLPTALVPIHIHAAGSARTGSVAAGIGTAVGVDVEDGQADLGVGLARGGVADFRGRGTGGRRIGDPPAEYTRRVHPGGQQPPAVRRPPVASRVRPISSAATNSADPQLTVSAGSCTTNRSPAASPVTRRADPAT